MREGPLADLFRKTEEEGPQPPLSAETPPAPPEPEPPSPVPPPAARRTQEDASRVPSPEERLRNVFSSDIPRTGASAKRTVLRILDANTRSPKFSSRISNASLACTVRVSTSVGRMPSISMSGLRFSRTMARVF